MRILLIQAPLGRRDHLVYPLGLACLAGAVEQADPGRHLLRFFDPNLAPETADDELREQLKRFEPDLVGVSLRNLDSQMLRDPYYYYPTFQSWIRRIRRLRPEATILVGGAGFSLFPRKIMERNPEIDLGLTLEAEATFPAYLRTPDRPQEIPGAWFRREGTLESTPPGGFLPFDVLPPARYDLLPPAPYATHRGAVGVQTKRGCALTCAYCTYPQLNGRRIRLRPPEVVLDELERLRDQHGLRDVQFVDAVFNLPRSHAEEIMQGMIQRKLGLSWTGYFHEGDFDLEFARLALASGCREFQFSPDGHSPCALKRLGKQAGPEDIQRILELARELPDLRFSLGYFWNPPGQDLRTWLSLIRLLLRCKLRLRRSCVGFVLAVPRIEPGTEIERIALQQGALEPETDLLPERVEDLPRVFYRNPELRILNRLFTLYTGLYRLRRSVLRRGRGATP